VLTVPFTDGHQLNASAIKFATAQTCQLVLKASFSVRRSSKYFEVTEDSPPPRGMSGSAHQLPDSLLLLLYQS